MFNSVLCRLEFASFGVVFILSPICPQASERNRNLSVPSDTLEVCFSCGHSVNELPKAQWLQTPLGGHSCDSVPLGSSVHGLSVLRGSPGWPAPPPHVHTPSDTHTCTDSHRHTYRHTHTPRGPSVGLAGLPPSMVVSGHPGFCHGGSRLPSGCCHCPLVWARTRLHHFHLLRWSTSQRATPSRICGWQPSVGAPCSWGHSAQQDFKPLDTWPLPSAFRAPSSKSLPRPAERRVRGSGGERSPWLGGLG